MAANLQELEKEVDRIAKEVLGEREYQVQKRKFDTSFDDQNRINDWISYITAYVSRHFCSNPMDALSPQRWAEFRVDLIKVAALAFAGIAAIDRRSGNPNAFS